MLFILRKHDMQVHSASLPIGLRIVANGLDIAGQSVLKISLNTEIAIALLFAKSTRSSLWQSIILGSLIRIANSIRK